jgi:PleD family two-component response regulator
MGSSLTHLRAPSLALLSEAAAAEGRQNIAPPASVDDDVFERMGASYMFADEGYRVLEAENVNEALRFLETNADITQLFTDVSMRERVGFGPSCCQAMAYCRHHHNFGTSEP